MQVQNKILEIPPQLTVEDKRRRAAKLCCYFVRNLAYYRGLSNCTIIKSAPFWLTAYNNFIDICSLEWCKLFGDKKAVHHWKEIVSDSQGFEAELLNHLGLTQTEWDNFIEIMRHYRDKFVAHLDNENVMEIPHMELAYKSVCFLYNDIFPSLSNKNDLPSNIAMDAFYQDCMKEISELNVYGFPLSQD